MKKLFFPAFAAIALIFAAPAFAADYPFTLRGVVDITPPTKSVVYVTVTSASTKAIAETQGFNLGYSISKAKIYKITNGVKKVALASAIKTDDEVVMKGNKVGGTFKVNELVINERTFEIIGKVDSINTDLKTIDVVVAHSTYREKGLKGNVITLKYNSATLCKRLGSTVACSTVPENKQVIKAKGSVTGANQVYELTNFWDQYK
jgi:hypothetical protein